MLKAALSKVAFLMGKAADGDGAGNVG